MMNFNVAVIPGDGINCKRSNRRNLMLTKFGHGPPTEVDMGGVSIDKHGVPLTDEALATAQKKLSQSPWKRRWCRRKRQLVRTST